MSKKIVQDSVTGSIKQPLGRLVLGGSIFFGVLASMAIFMPTFAKGIVPVASLMGITGLVSMVGLNYRSNLYLKFIGFVSLALLCTIIAIRSFVYLWPSASLMTSGVISFSVLIVHLLPIINSDFTWFLRGELSYKPKTGIGRIFQKKALAVLPLAGFIGGAIGLLMNGKGSELDISVIIVGPLCWFLALILPFSTTHQVSPWEPEKK